MANPLTSLFLDPAAADRARVERRYQFTDDWRAWALPLGIGAALLLVSLVALLGGEAERMRFFFAYLVGWVFCLSIAIGALFFVMIQHITKARWSTVLRRIPEQIAAGFPLLALLGAPLLLGLHDLYHWTHAELYDPASPYYDYVVAGKDWYLNTPFFLARIVAYFVVWSILGTRLYRLSVAQDTAPDPENTLRQRRVSAWGIPVAGVFTAFAGFDLVMSLDPHWFSTIFGVYFFAGGWLASLCAITFLALALRKAGRLEHEISREHYQDMGKLMFGFVVFWTYIAFSQYMLYWYGNLPEEIVWYQKRLAAGWGPVAQALIWFHFILPFLILLPRFTKRALPLLAVMAVWLLVMHWMDLFWLAMPAMHLPDGAAEAHATLTAALQPMAHGAEVGGAAAAGDVAAHGVPNPAAHVAPAYFSWVDFTAWLGLVGVFFGATLWRMGRHALTPFNDPYFEDSLRFENV